jgi:hypothetical protein
LSGYGHRNASNLALGRLKRPSLEDSGLGDTV